MKEDIIWAAKLLGRVIGNWDKPSQRFLHLCFYLRNSKLHVHIE